MSAPAAPTAETRRAIDALTHSGVHGGWDDFDNCPTEAYAAAFGPSRDGAHVVVKMTPEQALRFADLIAEDLD